MNFVIEKFYTHKNFVDVCFKVEEVAVKDDATVISGVYYNRGQSGNAYSTGIAGCITIAKDNLQDWSEYVCH